ncbi:MAG: substrate-binding domain-containing protein [Longimicrobiales bacterium]
MMDRIRRYSFTRAATAALPVLFGLLLGGCEADGTDAGSSASTDSAAISAPGGGTPAPANGTQLVLASTTSTEDSGLFDVLLPAFQRAHPELTVRLIAVGTGQALELGRRKDADVLLVHAPASESEFVSAGYGVRRCAVMYNDFVLVGPVGDPASIKGLRDPLEALRRIERSRSPFISRGDDSGTHKKELALWEEAHIAPQGSWYMEAGQGMGEVLNIAAEKAAYTLTDRATYLNVKDRNALEVLVEGDKRLINQYGVIPVTGARNAAGAEAFAMWITSQEGQQVIGDYGVTKFGRPLFVPNGAGCGSQAATR